MRDHGKSHELWTGAGADVVRCMTSLCRTLDETLELVKDIFSSAGERDIYTGDFVDIHIITKDGTKYEQFPLKKD